MDKEPFSPHTEEMGERPNDSSIDALPRALGFFETEELNQLKQRILESDSEGAQELLLEYRLRGEAVVETYTGVNYARAQIGLSVAVGLLRRDIGMMEAYARDLDDALVYAENMDFDNAVQVIEATMTSLAEAQSGDAERPQTSEAIANVLRGLGEEAGFDEQTCQEIANMSFEEAFETAYGYVAQAGEDPDEVLADFIQPTQE